MRILSAFCVYVFDIFTHHCQNEICRLLGESTFGLGFEIYANLIFLRKGNKDFTLISSTAAFSSYARIFFRMLMKTF